jgi:hypothetical protein
MTLLEEIHQKKPVRLCRFGKWIATAGKQDVADVATAFADPNIRGKWISDALSVRVDGHLLDYVTRHRRGACVICPKGPDFLNGETLPIPEQL